MNTRQKALRTGAIFIALLVLVNPIGAIPIFIGLTSGTSHTEDRKSVV